MHYLRGWEPSWVLVDQFPRTRKWLSSKCDWSNWDVPGYVLALDANGWVTQMPPAADNVCPRTLVFESVSSTPTVYPAGQYVILWEGNGTMEVSGDGAYEWVSGLNGRATFNITTPSGGFYITILATDSTNYLKNIRIIMPGGVCGRSMSDLDFDQECTSSRGGVGSCNTGETCFDFEQIHWNRFQDPVSSMNKPKVVFHPSLVKDFKKYRLVRFMNWMNINENGGDIGEWQQRTPVQYQNFAETRMMPYEYMIALSNLMGVDAWLTVPHRGSNAFNQAFAEMVRDTLDPKLKVYVEYSNETWNSMFHQSSYVQSEGERLGLPGSSSYEKGRRFHSQRTVEIINLWKQAFGTSANRVVGVMAGQSSVPSRSRQLLDWQNAYQSVNAFSVASYFGGYIGDEDNATRIQTWTLDNLFQEIFTGGLIPLPPAGNGSSGGALQEMYREIDQNVALATEYNLPLIGYEGGQHLVGTGDAQWNDAIKNLFVAANGDARMGQAYTQFLNYWKNSGAQAMTHYNDMSNWSRYGSWGIRTNPRQTSTESPKYGAIMSFIDQTPCWWPGCL